jgi:hypothetical protein
VTLSAADQAGGSGVAFVDYQVNGAALQRYSGPFTVAAQGVTRVTARATDYAGNVEALPPFVVVTIDTGAPVTAIALSGSQGLAGWYRSSVMVTLSAADQAGGSGVAFVDYQVNGAAFQRYSGPFAVVAEGATTIKARATDTSGNVETMPPFVVVTIDTGAPVVNVGSPLGRDYLHTDTLALSFSAGDDVSGLASGSPFATLDGASALNNQTIQLLTLPLGAHTFVASATDTAGNAAQRSVTFHVVATIQSLMAAVNVYATQGKIDPATKKSLLEKLNDAQAALSRGRVADVRRKLSDFIGICGKRVPAAVASVLVADAQYVLGTL